MSKWVNVNVNVNVNGPKFTDIISEQSQKRITTRGGGKFDGGHNTVECMYFVYHLKTIVYSLPFGKAREHV